MLLEMVLGSVVKTEESLPSWSSRFQSNKQATNKQAKHTQAEGGKCDEGKENRAEG